ncbi:MAG: RNA polymerase sigma-54 factor, partial [Deltaproteobacteria bacterium]|nr:RNA polymerase sigma-54 factor [Deltaproteobacteria bacterium]
MVIELRQQLKLTQQLIMTPQLQMAIKLLQLSRLELMDKISQELEENPALEEVQDVITSEEQPEKPETSAEEAPSEKEVTIEEKIPDEIDWSNYLDEYNSPGRVNFESEGKDSPRFDAFISKKESLTDHLLWQFLMTFPSAEEERIGSLIIGNLNKDGYLDATLEYIVENSGCELETVENVLAILQTFDPIGICSRDLGECLLIQAKHLGLEDDLLTEIITDHLAHLENKNYKAICRALKVRLEDVIAVVNV